MASTTQDSERDGDSNRGAPRSLPDNSLRENPARREQRERDAEPDRARARRRQFVNAISPTETPKRTPPAKAGRQFPTKDQRSSEANWDRDPRRDERAVPEEIKRRFVPAGNVYYFPDGARAFVDRGDRLTTRSENTEVIKSLVSIAKARGWEDITITGTQRFRKEMWFAAKLSNLEVRGHSPDQFEEGRLARALGRQGLDPAPAGRPVDVLAGRSPAPPLNAAAAQRRDEVGGPWPRTKREPQWVGSLIDHGAATYKHLPHRPMSYFVKIETRDGEKEIWGVDLQRAMRESLTRPQIGDQVALRRVRQDDVTVRSVERDSEGRVLSDKPLATHRNRWIIEKRDFFKERADAAKMVRDPSVDAKGATAKRPELVGTYMWLHAAEIAARRFPDPEEQRKFVSLVRSALADSVARGDPLKLARVRSQASGRVPRPRDERERVPEPVRGG